MTRIGWAFLAAVLLAASLGAQEPTAPTDIETLKAENRALRGQMLEQHLMIGQLQQALGTCNVQLAQTLRADLDAKTKK